MDSKYNILAWIGFYFILFAIGIAVTFVFLHYMQEATAFPYNYLELPNFYEYQYDRYLFEQTIYPSWMPTYTPYWLYETELCWCGTGDSISMEYDNYNYWDNQIAEQQLDDIYDITQLDVVTSIYGNIYQPYYNSIDYTYYGYD